MIFTEQKQVEEWRPIPGFDGLYEVSSQGRVRSLDRIDNMGRKWRGKIRNQKFIGRGYLALSLHKDGEASYHLVHRLVASAFIPNPDPENLTQVGHWDNNKNNNHVNNLYHTTPRENMHHDGNLDRLNQRIIVERSKTVYGINIQDPSDIISFYNAREAEEKGFTRGQIYICCNENKRRIKKTHKGYAWGYSIEAARLNLEQANNYIDPKSRPIVGVNIENPSNILRFNSIADAGRNGFCPTSVGYCCRGRTLSGVYKGYKWRYAS